ncbi:MAG TPA: lipoyl(octanoyl) transferase LipB [Tepidisphaeraceae bacterium]|jgi:lipoate-protein ligase B|nr:lipoyl(octanoyl) transferase LipB [Tepidisphaeraceae bacterium]
MQIQDLDMMPYRQAWKLQEKILDEVAEGGEERILLVEHPPVITFGRRAELSESHLRAPREQLANMNIDVVESDRGGDITFHGPGQIVAYPILRLADRRLSVGGYVHKLEDAVIDTLAQLNIPSKKDQCAVGVWVDQNETLHKVCAVGVRIKRGVTMHGLALNVEPDLTFFDLIVPCGLDCRPVTSLKRLLHHKAPSFLAVKQTLSNALQRHFAVESAPAQAP